MFKGLIAEGSGNPAISIQSAHPTPLEPSGQLTLSVNNYNPLLIVYQDEEHQQLLVYYGFEIIENVPDDTQAASYNWLLRCLYTSGAKSARCVRCLPSILKYCVATGVRSPAP
ncbi:MAG: hypothetical protein EXS25_10010 [Pedosphaera sp.]|nr:hypothetical protein [Pedosphaera sp.]